MDFRLPCGDSFDIPDAWWVEAGMVGFVAREATYRVISIEGLPLTIVPIEQVEPPRRNPSVQHDHKGFAKARMVHVLREIATNTPMAPIIVKPAVDPYSYRLYDGFHRFYASIGAGFPHLPVAVVSAGSPFE